MKIRLISDLHHEVYEDKELYKNKGEDVLVVAGDLAVGRHAVWSALKHFADNTENVIYVPGNHEYYGNHVIEFDYYLKQFSEGTNIHFLNPGYKKIGDVHFVGATLWTDFQSDITAKFYCARAITDFRVINRFTTDKAVELNTIARKYFEGFEQLFIEGKKVYVTHFLPTNACIAEEYKGEATVNKYFANDLTEFIDHAQPDYWLFGHTHSNINIQQGKTKLMANPYGYNRNNSYKEMLICL